MRELMKGVMNTLWPRSSLLNLNSVPCFDQLKQMKESWLGSGGCMRTGQEEELVHFTIKQCIFCNLLV
jgi:hypothetical protein